MCQIVYIFRVKQSLVLFQSFIPDKFMVSLCLTKYRSLFNCPLTTNPTASWCRLKQTIRSIWIYYHYYYYYIIIFYYNTLGFISTKHRGEQTCKYVPSTFRRRSGLHKHNTRSCLSINTHTQENIRISTVISSHTTHTSITPSPFSPGPVLPLLLLPRPRCASTQSPAVPEHPPSSLPPPPPLPPNTSPVGGVMSGFCGGLLLDRSRQSACL